MCVDESKYTNAPLRLSSERPEQGRTKNKMPKDPKRNRSYYDIGGGDINEFEFHRNQAAIAEEERARLDQLQSERADGEVPEGGPHSEAERIEQMMEDAREKVARRKARAAQNETGSAQAKTRPAKKSTGKTAGKGTAKRVATGSKKGSAAGKASAKKSAANKIGAKKSSVKKSAAKKNATGSRSQGRKTAARK